MEPGRQKCSETFHLRPKSRTVLSTGVFGHSLTGLWDCLTKELPSVRASLDAGPSFDRREGLQSCPRKHFRAAPNLPQPEQSGTGYIRVQGLSPVNPLNLCSYPRPKSEIPVGEPTKSSVKEEASQVRHRHDTLGVNNWSVTSIGVFPRAGEGILETETGPLCTIGIEGSALVSQERSAIAPISIFSSLGLSLHQGGSHGGKAATPSRFTRGTPRTPNEDVRQTHRFTVIVSLPPSRTSRCVSTAGSQTKHNEGFTGNHPETENWCRPANPKAILLGVQGLCPRYLVESGEH